jgi:hypothetical protein
MHLSHRTESRPVPGCRPALDVVACLKHRLNPTAQCSMVLANTPHTPKASIRTWQQQGNSRESQNAPLAPHGALAPFLQART